MTTKQARELSCGLYLIFWKKSEGGGHSYAAVGMMENGDRWIAPTNWVFPSGKKSIWRDITRVIKI